MDQFKIKKNDLGNAIKSYGVWSYLAWHDIRIRYRRSKIGPFWLTLSMSIFCLMLGLVYSNLFKTEIGELLPFLAIGLVVWGLVSGILGEMPNLFLDNSVYMKDMHINQLSILARSISRCLIIFFHNILIIIGIYIYFEIWPGWTGLLFFPGLVLVVANLAAMGLSVAILGARFRDINQINQNLLQLIFFITPILWLPKLMDGNNWILLYNPFSYYIELIRMPLLGVSPTPLSWFASVFTLIIFTAISWILYRLKTTRIVFWV
jgi:ABC-type polysaccharide/polyol phosphate export permease